MTWSRLVPDSGARKCYLRTSKVQNILLHQVHSLQSIMAAKRILVIAGSDSSGGAYAYILA